MKKIFVLILSACVTLSLAEEDMELINRPVVGSETIEEAVWMLNGRQVMNTEFGYSKSITTHDKKGGHVMELAFYDEKNRPIICSSEGAHLIKRSRYNKNGVAGEEGYFGTDGKPMIKNNDDGGYHLIKRSNGAPGTSRQSLFGIDGTPIVGKLGYASLAYSTVMVANGLEKETTNYLGVDGKPLLQADGYAKMIMTCNRDGLPVKYEYFGVDGNPSLMKNGYATEVRTVNADFYVTEISYLGTDGKPCFNVDGYAYVVNKYESTTSPDEVSEYQYLDTSRKPILSKSGYFRCKVKYNDDCNLLSREYFDIADVPVNAYSGYAKVICLWSQDGDLTMQFLNKDGKSVKPSDEDAERENPPQ